MPLAAGFLWNPRMMIHMTARGYATAQFMQPEPSKYAHAQIMEAKHFMLPEQGTYAHHPGRFFFVKDRDSGNLFSAPYEPARAPVDSFSFDIMPSLIHWDIKAQDVHVDLRLSLPADDACELWEVRLTNIGSAKKRLSFYPAFPLGLLSWMNQSATYDRDLNAIVADSVTPYQKTKDYFKNKDLKDKVYLLSEQQPESYETRQPAFEGEGGLHRPDAVTAEMMSGGDASYENPIAALQFDHELAPGETTTHRFLFGPAFDKAEIVRIKDTYLSASAFANTQRAFEQYITSGRGVVSSASPDAHFDAFVNTWLPRQVYYHGDTNRLSTDPQTRNFLQDAIGSVYVAPETARKTLLKALSQQHLNGALPDGVKLYDGAELKYINTVPHVDHSLWLVLFLDAYLSETDDYAILDQLVVAQEDGKELSVRERTDRAMRYLVGAVDERNLHYILEGDWNDPMNMVGWKGKGVSGWMSVASAYALKLWAEICRNEGRDGSEFASGADGLNAAVNKHMWDGDWFGRGITDDGVLFGVKVDDEGKIYLNPQSFALMGGAADKDQSDRIVRAVEQHLEGPYGVEMLGPAYTHMRDDVGRLTQKYPGVAENGSVYNHAAAFYIFALYGAGYSEKANSLLRRMLPGPDLQDYLVRGQLPVFVPNYYRGAYKTNPKAAGRSSHLFNTGTAAWMYRSVVEGMLGLRGCRAGLRVDPKLPSAWPSARVTRRFRGATFDVHITRGDKIGVACDGSAVSDGLITGIETGKTYQVEVVLPTTGEAQ
ncbi:cyclic beta-1, 2 glucan synthetase, putative, cgs94A [Auricularia subglabra TFB-10046 SS5]|nr:cyclic beta-1, 2 glucan synthetase, putative, cgs94A [Auricularia subglabra TFB-10046 SS5]